MEKVGPKGKVIVVEYSKENAQQHLNEIKMDQTGQKSDDF